MLMSRPRRAYQINTAAKQFNVTEIEIGQGEERGNGKGGNRGGRTIR